MSNHPHKFSFLGSLTLLHLSPLSRLFYTVSFASLFFLFFIIPCKANGIEAFDNTLRQDLVQIRVLLQKVNPVIAQARASQAQQATKNSQNQPMYFQFDQLQTDLDTIITGISDALSNSPLLPRTLETLRGDYVDNAQ